MHKQFSKEGDFKYDSLFEKITNNDTVFCVKWLFGELGIFL